MTKRGNNMIKLTTYLTHFHKKTYIIIFHLQKKKGQHCAFIGASGSGKSTLIDIIMDKERYLFDGKIEIDPNCKNWICKSVFTM